MRSGADGKVGQRKKRGKELENSEKERPPFISICPRNITPPIEKDIMGSKEISPYRCLLETNKEGPI